MKYNQIFKTLSAAVAASLLVAACGGGGGGSSSSNDSAVPSRTDISEAQATQVAQSVMMDSVTLMDGSSPVMDYLGNASAATLQTATAAGTSARPSEDNLTLKVIQYIRRNQPIAAMGVSAAATENEDVPCDSGFMRVVENFSSYDEYRVGDKVTVTSDNCVIDGMHFLGSFNATLNAVRGDPYSESSNWGLTLATTYSGFGAVDSSNTGATLTGDMTLALDVQPSSNYDSIVASGKHLKATHIDQGSSGDIATFNSYNIALAGDFDQETFKSAGNVFGNSGELGNYSYTVATPIPFAIQAADVNPSSGQLVITGANATVSVIAIDANTVRVDYTDANGTRSQTMTWAQFES